MRPTHSRHPEDIIAAQLRDLCRSPETPSSFARSERRRGARTARRKHREVALPVDILMPFSGSGHIKRAVGVTNIGADRIVERAITARDKCISAAGRIVAAGTVGFTLGNVAAVIVAGLTR
jgi:hypothetical protein